MIRVPLPSGAYISRSITPLDDELATIELCKKERDKLAIPIWGEEAWIAILHVPARSVTRARKETRTPANGITLREREGRTPYYIVSWYEYPDPGGSPRIESQTHGKRLPRKKKTKTFSFGTPNARFARQETALRNAKKYLAAMRRKHHVFVHSTNNEVAD